MVVLSTLALHELGHYLQMYAAGIKTERITLGIGPSIKLFGKFYLGLFPIGASVTPNPEQWDKASPYNRFMVAVAGPIASFCGGFLMLGLGILHPDHGAILSVFAGMHFILGAMNLIPIPPLDGWEALTSLLRLKNNPLSETTLNVARRAGNGLIYGIGFWFIGKILTGEL